RRTFARETAQLAERELDVARAELHGVVEVPVLPVFPHLDRAPVAGGLLPDPHALRVVAEGTERGRAGGADPLAAALVALPLLVQPFPERLHEALEPAERPDLRLLLLGKGELRLAPHPVLGQRLGELAHVRVQPVDVRLEDA